MRLKGSIGTSTQLRSAKDAGVRMTKWQRRRLARLNAVKRQLGIGAINAPVNATPRLRKQERVQ